MSITMPTRLIQLISAGSVVRKDRRTLLSLKLKCIDPNVNKEICSL